MTPYVEFELERMHFLSVVVHLFFVVAVWQQMEATNQIATEDILLPSTALSLTGNTTR